MDSWSQLANFLYELGTLRTTPRAHQPVFLESDPSDSIAAHSFRVAMIGWVIARAEGLDVGKVLRMCLIHDVEETRSGDHNHVAKRYVTIDTKLIAQEQLAPLPFGDFVVAHEEYEKRESREAIAAKDADLIDQLLLLREYELKGNQEAARWRRVEDGNDRKAKKIGALKLESSRRLAEAVWETSPSEWWKSLYQSENRTT